jgi:hypothetical protein
LVDVPPFTASKAERRALVPDLVAPTKSAVLILFSRSSAAATNAEFCLNIYGWLVVARYSPSIASLFMPFKQSTPAATAILRVSSSWLAIAFSPGGGKVPRNPTAVKIVL